MSLIFTDTFVNYPSGTSPPAGKMVFGGAFYNRWGVGRTPGTQAMGGNGGQGQAKRIVAAADEHATFIAGGAFWRSATVADAPLISLMSDAGATTHLTVSRVDSGGLCRVWRGAVGGTLLGTSTLPIMGTGGVYYYLEVKATLDDSVGAVEVLIDGTSILSLTGIDTKNAGTKTVFDAAQWYAPGSNWQLSDVYLCNGAGSLNNDFLYAPRIYALAPSGNGNSSMGVNQASNSTNNYDSVNDWPTNPAGYVDLLATDDKDTYAFDDVTGLPTTNAVKGAMVWSYAQKTDAGARTLKHVARSGSSETDVTSAPDLVNGTYGLVGAPFETLPGGGTFDIAALNAMEFGIKAG